MAERPEVTTAPAEYSAPPRLNISEKDLQIYRQQSEVLASMDAFVENCLDILIPTEKAAWKPSDYLPDFSQPDWQEQVTNFREVCDNVPGSFFVILAVNTATEEALPSYAARLQQIEAVKDQTGTDDHPWATGSREWTSQEYFHGEYMMTALRLSGRVDMGRLEVINANLIRNGFNMNVGTKPYRLFNYTDNQERATKIVHAKTAQLARMYGDHRLADALSKIAGDEARHERYYEQIVLEIFRRDPEGAIISFNEMMQDRVVMPTRLIDDTETREAYKPDLFENYGRLVASMGVYTPADYAAIFAHMVAKFGIDKICVTGEAAQAQEATMLLLKRHLETSERLANRKIKAPSADSFSFILPHPNNS